MIRVIDQDGTEHRVESGTVVKVLSSWGEVAEWKILSCGDDEYHYEIASPGKEHGFCYHVRQVEENLRKNGAKLLL